jgi:hypothetical protein
MFQALASTDARRSGAPDLCGGVPRAPARATGCNADPIDQGALRRRLPFARR